MTALKPLMDHLVEEMQIEGSLAGDTPGSYSISLDEGVKVIISEIPRGFMLKCAIAPCPNVKEEIFLTQAMLGNLFGQGTNKAVLGLTPDGTTLTLAHVIDYDVEYREFRDVLEDFVNAVDLWRDEVANHK